MSATMRNIKGPRTQSCKLKQHSTVLLLFHKVPQMKDVTSLLEGSNLVSLKLFVS